MLELARKDADDPVAFLDSFVFDIARDASRPCVIDCITSPTDYATPGVLEFAAVVARNPLLQVRVHHSDYHGHNGSGEVFFAFLRETLATARPL